MLVVRLVAAGAILGYRLVQISIAVTIAAADVGMTAQQGETRFARMIESLREPVGRRVAVGTLDTLAALVHIVG